MDLIRIVDYEIEARVGVSQQERAKPQRLLVCLDLWLPLERAVQTQDLSTTVDYEAVGRLLKQLAAERKWILLERVAADIAEALVNEFKVRKLRVEVKKFGLPEARYVSVELVRET